MGIRILGTGSYLPPLVVSNDDLAKVLDTSDEWIFSHTGIHSRHAAEEGETTSTMAAKAARRAMEARFKRPVRPGDRLTTVVKIVRERVPLGVYELTGYVGEELAATAKVKCMLMNGRK